ncbi:MAG TPA: M20/M25/M40 family metallo-hydrolase [Longimicrobiales bacterium]|nr:M20/M25/M40 family metallo-hydrolase [Longimicrobiales bacterium]
MRAFRIASCLAVVLAANASAQTASDAAKAAATITPADVKAHIAYIASDELKGRDTPSPGLELAAKYIADHFKTFGLKPAGDSGTFLQRWPYQSKSVDNAKTITELGGKQKRTLKYGNEYFVIPSMTGDSITSMGVVFTGPATAIAGPNAAAAGKIVAYTLPGGELNQAWAQPIQNAVMAAVGSGAKGVLFVLDKEFGADDIAEVVHSVAGMQTPIPILGIRSDIAEGWSGEGATISVRTAMTGISATPPNVVGILEGSDPVLKDTYVVFSAHMDHIGVSSPNEKGDSINNGADDDASGTTAVLELAQAFSTLKQRPKRSLIFLTVSGEEKGLFGSAYFTQHPPVPIEKIVADINIDMIGRNNPDTTVAIGQEYTSLGAVAQTVAKAHPELHLKVAPDLWPEESLFTRSDHFNFAQKKVAAIFFTSGLHPDYHKVSDEPVTIDNDKLARTARLIFWLGTEVANNPAAPTWTEAGRKIINQGGGQ